MNKNQLIAALAAKDLEIADRDDHIKRLKVIIANRYNGGEKRTTYSRTKTPEQIAAHTKYQEACAIAKANPGMLLSDAMNRV